MNKPKVIFNNVYKEYSLAKSNKDKLVEFFFNRQSKKSFFAVKNVNFEVYPGETIGVIGINGSGKSTLSNLLSEVIPPSAGQIDIDGEPSLIAISVGLNSQLSGLENIQLKCMMHGMSLEEIEKLKPKIKAFADIGDFIEQPVKNYSSGMRSRLGFAISVHTNPDILVVDEALSVGDQTFYEKCMKKIDEFKQQGKTIFFVSHSTAQMRKVSDRVIWMHYGEIKEFGEKNKVLNNYKEFIVWFNQLTEKEKTKYKEIMFDNQRSTIEDQRNLQTTKRQIFNEERKERTTFLVQLIPLIVLTLFLMILMITGTSLSQFLKLDTKKTQEIISDDRINDHQVEVNDEDNSLTTKIDKKGYVAVENAIGFTVEEMTEGEKYLPIFTAVTIIEQINDNKYKIKLPDGDLYIDINSISIMNDDNGIYEELTITDFLPFLPESFGNSYLYYLDFLNKSISYLNENLIWYEEIKGSENVRSFKVEGKDIMYYSEDNETIKSIEIPIVTELSAHLFHDINKYGLVSNDEDYFFIKTANYEYVINSADKTITISRNGSI